MWATRARATLGGMRAGSLSTFLARIDAAEYGLCRCLNSGASHVALRGLLRIVSRLGDGIAWYVLILVLPLLYGRAALRPALAMAVTGIVGLVIYRWLKRTFVRRRPFVTHPGIDCAAAPLDFYSFPSGHTLHAVAFTWQAVAHFGELAFLLVPFTVLIAVSRVVLGLHYPSDVLIGAVLGALLAALGLAIS